MQHIRPPCPSQTPGPYLSSCPLSQWCHPIISSSVVPFSSCPQSLSASGSFQMSQLFTSSGQSIGVSASTSVLPMNIQYWFPLGWWMISFRMDLLAVSKGLSRVFSNTTVQKHQFFETLANYTHQVLSFWVMSNRIEISRWEFQLTILSFISLQLDKDIE